MSEFTVEPGRTLRPGSPGTLRSEAFLEIQTRQAQKLVQGRESGRNSPAIIGLLAFGRRMKQLWLSAQYDDPYADWWLLQIEAAIDETRASLEEKTRWLKDVLEGMDGVQIGLACSLQPIRIALHFSNPYGYMGAYLIADYDALTRAVLTARHFALLDRDQSQAILHTTGRAIRRTFNAVTDWRYTAVTRADVQQGTAAALRARELMGELPVEVLGGQRRARMAPALRQPDHQTGDRVSRAAESVERHDQETVAADIPGPTGVAARQADHPWS